jgi:hypothetical protein
LDDQNLKGQDRFWLRLLPLTQVTSKLITLHSNTSQINMNVNSLHEVVMQQKGTRNEEGMTGALRITPHLKHMH